MWNKFIDLLPYLTNLISIPFTAFFTYLFLKKHDNNKDKNNKEEEQVKMLQSENDNLLKEINIKNDRLKKFTAVKQAEDGNYFVLLETNQSICPVCWGNEQKAIPVYGDGNGLYFCKICNTHNTYNFKTKKESDEGFSQLYQDMKKPDIYGGYFKNWNGQ